MTGDSRSPTTLGARIEAATAGDGAVTFVSEAGSPRVEWSRLHDDARATAGALQRRGVGPGAHVALLGPTSRPLVTALQAVWLAGATAVVVPLPHRIGAAGEMVTATRSRIEGSGAAVVLADPALAPFIEPGPGDPPVVLLRDLEAAASDRSADRFDPPPADPSALAAVQFTSGATAEPRGVTLTHAAVVSNLDAVARAAGVDPEDVIVSWLPLYHDMGLFGLLTLSMLTGTDLVLGTPLDFMADPRRWAQWISEFGGTATAGPGFSYALLARALARPGAALDLSRWRIALNGAESVDPQSAADFVAAGQAHRLDAGAVLPAFGMAEVVIGATLSPPGRGLTTDAVDRAALEEEGVAAEAGAAPGDVCRLARLGRPVDGLNLRICDPDGGEVLGERLMGELELRGASVTSGYHADDGATAAAFHDGWLRTGDLAYVADGELVVCTRLADVLAVGSRRLRPEAIERVASGADGVRPGNVAAFGVARAVVVAAEVRGGVASAVRRDVAERVAAFTGLPAPDVVLLPPGALPKTSSGKLQRWKCRLGYLADGLQPA